MINARNAINARNLSHFTCDTCNKFIKVITFFAMPLIAINISHLSHYEKYLLHLSLSQNRIYRIYQLSQKAFIAHAYCILPTNEGRLTWLNGIPLLGLPEEGQRVVRDQVREVVLGVVEPVLYLRTNWK